MYSYCKHALCNHWVQLAPRLLFCTCCCYIGTFQHQTGRQDGCNWLMNIIPDSKMKLKWRPWLVPMAPGLSTDSVAVKGSQGVKASNAQPYSGAQSGPSEHLRLLLPCSSTLFHIIQFTSCECHGRLKGSFIFFKWCSVHNFIRSSFLSSGKYVTWVCSEESQSSEQWKAKV